MKDPTGHEVNFDSYFNDPDSDCEYENIPDIFDLTDFPEPPDEELPDDDVKPENS
jgi:hypothetical protein